MVVVLQRVSSARVKVQGSMVGAIGPGVLLLVGIAKIDEPRQVSAMADKIAGLRMFGNPQGRTDLDLSQVRGAVLAVPQFTLLADLRRGRRPDFSPAAEPIRAREYFELFVKVLREKGFQVEKGSFGENMQVELVNEGPFTLVLDSADWSRSASCFRDRAERDRSDEVTG